jgi:hypothetical protein
MNAYLEKARLTGSEVPAAMRPILQSMMDQGLLLDGNGNKITDLKDLGITFAESMTSGFNRIVEKLQELIDRLGLAKAAVEDIPNDVPINFDIEEPVLPTFETQVVPVAFDVGSAELPTFDTITVGVQFEYDTPSFHHGGMIQKAHSGLFVNKLGPDQVPIIAQTGEGILSRRGMAALGALNGGRPGSVGGNMGGVERRLDRLEETLTRMFRDQPRQLGNALKFAAAT